MQDDEVFHVMRRVLQEHASRWQAALPELTKPQYAVLRAIHEDSGLEQSALIKAAASTKATLAELLSRLEDRGLVVRYGDSRDKRRRYVELTAEGRRTVLRAGPVVSEVDESMIECLRPREREQLLAMLRRMVPSAD
ncbi:MarR family transcriptional regulator [Nocardia sp. JMUB6875]|uniref:MarR family winged helix-turn-helix transcriptional regulator n=1 Tax=Nocardia sp. JMUB6875 TaxID=3158170 RepID=UPI0032E788DC